ncbi:MAG: Rap1a/Tai family immunity protein [Stellaceae bacterium]
MRKDVLAAALVAVAFPAYAQSGMSGYNLQQACNSNDPVLINACTLYASGFVDGLWTGQILVREGHAVCPPAGVSTGQAVEVEKKFLNDNPQELHRPASEMITAAIVLAWPCARKTK